jgi:hypothetical protein
VQILAGTDSIFTGPATFSHPPAFGRTAAARLRENLLNIAGRALTGRKMKIKMKTETLPMIADRAIIRVTRERDTRWRRTNG